LAELAAIWVRADAESRRVITAATHALDQELQAAPDLLGESRGENERVLFAYPLALWIEIDHTQLIVWVLHVWQIRRRGH
jgi:hypothetical protein